MREPGFAGVLLGTALLAGVLPGGVLPGGSATADGAAVTARLVPSVERVASGADFDIEVRIDEGEAWNGYELTLTYDPGLVSLVTRPAAEAEGALMTAACATRWHHLEADTGRIVLSHVLLCPGARVTGPGTLYRLRFTSNGPAGLAHIQVEGMRFLEAGEDLSPVETHDATVQVGASAPVEEVSWGRIKLRF